MGDKTPPDLQGFLIPSAQFSATNLVAKDDSTTPSTYTQAGNRTGVPKAASDSGMVLQGSGTQDEDGHIEIVCQRAGLPGLERGGFVWRDEAAGDTTSEFYGWDSPALSTGFVPLDWTTANRDGSVLPDAIRLDNGSIGVVHGQNTSTNTIQFSTYSPASSAWTSSNERPDTISHTVDVVSLVQLPKASGDANGRILCFYGAASGDQIDVMRSDDLMVSWTVAGRRILSTPVGATSMSQMRVRYSNGQMLMIIAWDNSGTETHAQYVSTDLGASFQQIEADFQATASEESNHPAIVPLFGSGFLVATHKSTATAEYRLRKIGSAADKLSSADGSDVPSGNGQQTLTPGNALFRAEDGAIYHAFFQSSPMQLRMRRTQDEGISWTPFANVVDYNGGWIDGGGTNPDTYLHTFAAEEVGGRVFLIHRHANPLSAPSYAGSAIAALELGGHSRNTAPAHKDSPTFTDSQLITWGRDDGISGVTSTGLQGNQWVPISTPSTIATSPSGTGTPMWVKGGAGTGAITVDAELSIDTSSATYTLTRTSATSASVSGITSDPVLMFAEFALEIDSGDGDSTTEEISVHLRLTDGEAGAHTSTFFYEVTARLSSAGYRIYDEQAGPAQVGSAQTVDLTSRKHIRVALDSSGNVRTWHCSDEHNRKWVEGASGSGLTAATNAQTDSRVQWGHRATTTATSRWSLIGFNFWGERAAAMSPGSIAKAWTNPDDLHGRSFPTEPALVAKGARVRAIDGPAYLGDTWDVVARYDHPVSFAFQDVDPSPRRLWRSTSDNSAIDLVVNLDATSGKSRTLGESIGIFVRGANFPAFTLSRWNGSAWVTVGTATGKIGPLAWRRNGEFVELDTGTTATISQFVRWGDFDGGTMRLDGSPDVYRKVERHTSGAWSSGTASRPVFQLADTKASDPTAGTEGELWTTDYGVVVHDHGNGSGSNIYRIQIPASETAADYYTGKFIVGGVHPFGWPHDRNWSMREEHDVDLVTRPGGMRTATKRGPPRRALEVTWVQTSIDETLIRKTLTASALPDYVAANANPSATRHSTISDVMGTLRMQSGPKDPVIFIRQIAPGQASQQYTTKDLWIHGRVETTDPQMDNVVGREATNPLGKLNTILIVEEV